ncbi:nucleoside deaminase [Mesorhizobium sp.]|uniref:nucleoside deaminase n=1 Tax=Mesorhizobium sp. TaxID=1871066 RepID=UPI0025BA89E6|nr:nucleoside deaminase [Mesorhizobium sp.]
MRIIDEINAEGAGFGMSVATCGKELDQETLLIPGEPLMSPEELMAEAIAISRQAVSNPAHRPFAAFIVKDGEIVGKGLNDTPSSHDPTAHGEVLAIRDATKRLSTQDLSGCEIYTTCEPCSLCVAAIWWAGLDKMYYAATLKDCAEIGIGVSGLVEEIAKPVNARKMKAEQILGDESRAVLKEWAKSPGFLEF